MPHAVAMYSMGLLEASIKENGMETALKKFLKWQKEDEPVKVICISGRKLFGYGAPLEAIARAGRIEALLPISNKDNTTIRFRYETYKPNFRKSIYPTPDDLVREIEISKGILLENIENKIYEHDELCMWRVVLLSNHCLVQNYFPNFSGEHSTISPVFVFFKETVCPHSYYETFAEMFKILSKVGKLRQH
jgi:hypothetical protein